MTWNVRDCITAVFRLSSDKWGGAAAIAVNHTCIKLVATIRTMHDADAAAVATDAEECVRIADTSVDRVQWESRSCTTARSTPVQQIVKHTIQIFARHAGIIL